MENTVNERIKILVDELASGNKSSFARSIGISNQSLGEIIGGRQSAPSFAALQKLFVSFPQVRMEWLVLGKGPMLQEEVISAVSEAPEHATRAQLQEIEYATKEQLLALDKEIAKQRQLFEAYKYDLSEKVQLEQVYRIVGSPEYDKMLYVRLSMTPDEARDLVLSGRIRSTYAGKDNDRARRNGVSYLVSEAAVREFLGDKPKA